MGQSCAPTGKQACWEDSVFVWSRARTEASLSQGGGKGGGKPGRRQARAPTNTKKVSNVERIRCGDDSDLVVECAGVLSAKFLLPGCAGRDAGQRICAGRDAGPPARSPGWDSHDGRSGDADHTVVPL